MKHFKNNLTEDKRTPLPNSGITYSSLTSFIFIFCTEHHLHLTATVSHGRQLTQHAARPMSPSACFYNSQTTQLQHQQTLCTVMLIKELHSKSLLGSFQTPATLKWGRRGHYRSIHPDWCTVAASVSDLYSGQVLFHLRELFSI